MKSALARYTPSDFIKLVEKHGIAYHEKTLGQLFCDGSARAITGMLEEECRRAAVHIFSSAAIEEVRKDSAFVVRTAAREFRASSLVVATGGLSIPKMGASGFGYDLARQFGLSVKECRPALVPLTFTAADCRRYCDLAGVSTEVIASSGRQRFREKMLITHRGLSGPAILQVSSYWNERQPISIDLAPEQAPLSQLLDPKARRDLASAKAALRRAVPHRLADRWMEQHAPLRWTTPSLRELERQVHNWEIVPSGTEGYEKAEVTAGGVDSDELSAKTMESRRVPGLFFIGEVVDVTGQLGGFNFQWAWASGFCAGQEV